MRGLRGARAIARLAPLLAFLACDRHEVRLSLPPVAFAGFEAEVIRGDTVILDGSRSEDPDGEVLSYAWRLEAAPEGSTARLTGEQTPVARFVADQGGHFVASLTVFDGLFFARDLVGIAAIEGTDPAGELTLALEPRACNADLETLAGCPAFGTEIILRPILLSFPAGAEDTLAIEWRAARVPPGVGALELAAREGPLGPAAFSPPREGDYWIEARLVGPASSSSPALAAVGVFAGSPAAMERSLPRLEGPREARVGDRLIIDARQSVIPPSANGALPVHSWRLVADPSGGRDEFSDAQTGCPADQCRRLIPSARGTYIVSLEISVDGSRGVAGVHAVEVD